MGLISRVSSRTYSVLLEKNISKNKQCFKMAVKDPELMKAFDELRKVTTETRNQQMQLKAEIEGNQRLAKRDELINKELSILPDDRNYYMSVGRMFMMQPKADIMKSLEGRQEQYQKVITNMKAQHEILQKNYQNKESELRELMKRKQGK